VTVTDTGIRSDHQDLSTNMPQPRCKCPVRLPQSLAALFVAACGQLCTLQAQTNSIVYFLVGTIPWGAPESYVLPLSEPEDIAHARWLIAEDAIAGKRRAVLPCARRAARRMILLSSPAILTGAAIRV
jgi:hypothetical protein